MEREQKHPLMETNTLENEKINFAKAQNLTTQFTTQTFYFR